jgi:hypothetical protein
MGSCLRESIVLVSKNENFIVILIWFEFEPNHYVNKEWKRDPFGAEMDESGNIYGRGAQVSSVLF